MSIATREQLRADRSTALTWRLVPDALGPGLDAYLRGYTMRELSSWREFATTGDKVDVDQMQALQVASCVAVDEQGTLLFAGGTGRPDRSAVQSVNDEVAPGALVQLIAMLDKLSGFGQEKPSLGEALTSGTTSAGGASAGSDDIPENLTS